MSHTLPFKHRISLRGRHTLCKSTIDKKETAVMVEYRIPFGLPVCQKKNIGILRGQIYDAETQEAIRDLVIRVNGYTAVTDSKGCETKLCRAKSFFF